jgi:hypothetical protein
MSTKLPTMVAIAALLTVLPSRAPVAQQNVPAPITCVIELYTSQGCSSCPPADALLKTYTEREGILALSFNVDIWDNLGWKDTLAKAEYTKRQQTYARTRGDAHIYTPQAMINGMAHTTGSDRTGIEKEIKATNVQRSGTVVSLTVRPEAEGVRIDTGAVANMPIDATVWLVKFTPHVEVAIQRGENAGRTVTYHNVVREFTSVGTWAGNSKSTWLPRTALTGCTTGTCAVLLQQGGTGSILGASWVPAPNGA